MRETPSPDALYRAFEDARNRAIAATEEYQRAPRADPATWTLLLELATTTTQEAALRLKLWLRAEGQPISLN